MKLFFIDTRINNSELKSSLNCEFHSEIIYKNQKLSDRLKGSLSNKFSYEYCRIDDIHNLYDEEGVFWCSEILFKNYDNQKLFLEKILYSISPFIWGNSNSYIFKGKFSELKKFRYSENDLKDSLVKISDLKSFQSIIDEDFDTRYFNEIFKVDDTYIKKSADVVKLKKEFEFLNSVPDQLKKYFISVSKFQESEDGAQYSMPKIGYLDVSKRYLHGKISKEEIVRFLEELKHYFDLSKNLSFESRGNEFDFIYSKTLDRYNEFKEIELFSDIEDVFKQNNLGSLDDNYNKLFDMLLKKENEINSSGSIFSHGDLCLSNILASENFDRIVLIDPRGGSYQESIRSIYYDFAKLSHSIKGNYDKIVNGMADMRFDDELNITLHFKGDENHIFSSKFIQFVSDYGLNPNIMRMIEASLFLSMLPLHSEKKSKVVMLAINGCQILDQLK